MGYCPLCRRRGWHVYNSEDARVENISGDDRYMRRLAGKAKWDAAIKNGTIVRDRLDLVDDGALLNDRRILSTLGVAKEDKMLFCTKPNNEHGDTEQGNTEEAAEVIVKTEERTQDIGAMQDVGRACSRCGSDGYTATSTCCPQSSDGKCKPTTNTRYSHSAEGCCTPAGQESAKAKGA